MELIQAFGLDVRILLAQLVNFAVLMWILHRFAYQPILKTLAERREKIALGVQKADAADRTLRAAQEEGEVLIGNAAREAQTLVAAARSRADEKAGEIVRTAEEKAVAALADAAARAEETKRRVLAEGEREIVRAAMLAAEKILHEKRA